MTDGGHGGHVQDLAHGSAPPCPTCLQVLEPDAPAETGTAQPKMQPFALQSQNHGHQPPEGLRALARGRAGWQGRDAEEADLALPVLDAKPAEDDQVAGIGAVAAPDIRRFGLGLG